MIRTKVLVSVSIGTLVYVLMSICFGRSGMWAMKQLENQKRDISIHTAEIAKINGELSLEYTALKQDMDVVAAYARRLGYVAEGEKLVKISGLKPYYEPLYDAGTVMRKAEVIYVPEWICKVLGMVTGLLLFLLLLLRDFAKNPSYSKVADSKSYSAGIKVHSYESIAGIKVETL
ncbi:MAG: septum formation initiator family protein [Spirochaetaceae bacterium]|nr:septum formation initiator family protein [Spirochaetaceae bacterium]